MLTDDLFQRVLIEPVSSSGADTLMAVSGYATANMVYHHLKMLEGSKIDLNVIVGMAKKDGIERAQHVALNKIVKQSAFKNTMACNYMVKGNPVHAKVYVWLRGDEPVSAFSGSANYTLTGFGRSQIEVMDAVDPKDALQFYKQCLLNAVSCDAENIEGRITITETHTLNVNPQVNFKSEFVTLSLVTKTGDTHKRAGLNWGQRPKRNPDQAYIPVPREVQLSGFFPDTTKPFTVLTDDDDSFIFVRAQTNGKALHSPSDNSQIGRYIRSRIGVSSGEYVTRHHLDEYGRTDITFTKIDEETYFLDFKPKFGSR